MSFWGQTASTFKQPPSFEWGIQPNSAGHLTLKSHLLTFEESDLLGGSHSSIYLFVGGFLSKTSTIISWLQVSRGETIKEMWIFCSHCNISQTRRHSTVTAILAVGDSNWVSIDDIQEEVGWVVVGFTGVSFQMKTPFIHILCGLRWSDKNVIFVPMSAK